MIRAFPVLSQVAISPRVIENRKFPMSKMFKYYFVSEILVVFGVDTSAVGRFTSLPVVTSKL